METTVTYNEFQKLKLDGFVRTEQGYTELELTTSPIAIPQPNKNPFYPTPQNSPSSSAPESSCNPFHLNFSEDVLPDSVVEELVKEMEISRNPTYKNTYFLDGGSRFISLPSLGNSSTKGASQISRIFEEWLESKIYFHPTPDTVPILEESVANSAHDVMRKLRSRANRTLSGLSKVLVKIRAGHVYNYHDYDFPSSGKDHLCLEDDIAGFFQQFPLFVELTIITKPSESGSSAITLPTEVLLTVENAGVNPAKPFMLREVFCSSEEGQTYSRRSSCFSPMSL